MSKITIAASGGVDSGVAAALLLDRGEDVRALFMRHRYQPTLDPDASRDALAKWGSKTNLTAFAVGRNGELNNLNFLSTSAAPLPFALPVDAAAALELSAFLGIDLTILDVDKPFAGVVENFVEEYFAARTPNPCVLCNRTIKFGVLWAAAKRLGAEKLATGHYVRKVRVRDRLETLKSANDGEFSGVNLLKDDDSLSDGELKNGERTFGFLDSAEFIERLKSNVDAELIERSPSPKDQSYFLYSVAPAALRDVVFPVGELEKSRVREIAAEKGLPIAARKESQEVCFVPDKARLEFIRSIRDSDPARWGALPTETSGDFVSLDGRKIGKHAGYEKFTVGQRKGLGMGFCERIFVQRVDPATRAVVLGPYDALAADKICAVDANWQANVPRDRYFRCEVKIRYRNESVGATVRAGSDGTLTAILDEPRYGVAPGQALVCYWRGLLLGGGRIVGSERVDAR